MSDFLIVMKLCLIPVFTFYGYRSQSDFLVFYGLSSFPCKYDFYKLAAANTEDSTMLEVTGGKGDFPEEYENTVLSLKTGEVSEVIKTTDYYYIFYCVRDFDIDATHEKKEEIIANRQEEEFQTRYKEWRGTTHIEVNEEVWDALDFDMESVG